MSDDEFAEEETTSNTSKKGDEAFAKAKAGLSKSDLDDQGGFYSIFPTIQRRHLKQNGGLLPLLRHYFLQTNAFYFFLKIKQNSKFVTQEYEN